MESASPTRITRHCPFCISSTGCTNGVSPACPGSPLKHSERRLKWKFDRDRAFRGNAASAFRDRPTHHPSLDTPRPSHLHYLDQWAMAWKVPAPVKKPDTV